MKDDRFEWDDEKAAKNERRHGVTFERARKVFDDPNAIDEPDDDPDEERWRRIAMAGGQVLFVVTTERDGRQRIITARRATRNEQDRYYRQALP